MSVYHFDPDVKGYRSQMDRPVVVTLELEPEFLSVGANHLACGLNIRVVFYELGKTDWALQLETREFHWQVLNLKLTDTLCSVLCGCQVILQKIGSHWDMQQIRRDDEPYDFNMHANNWRD